MEPSQKTKSKEIPRVVGIDPGSTKAGIAYITGKTLYPFSPKDFKLIDVLTLAPKGKISLNKRVHLFHETIYSLLSDYKPTHCAIETCFVGVNPQSAIKLGLVRGAIITAVSRLGIPILEIAPTTVKKIITGHGHAKKEEVALCLETLLACNIGDLSYDASDALAIALSCGLSLAGQEKGSILSL